jgi:exonuclease SbcC
MKIHSISLKNLNSLKGDHCVAFNTEPLAGAGLFAITGPTGAGKSTLLDAMTLALFGRAARYGNESNPEDVMSRHCGECYAEVVFEVPAGVYRATWERHRARNKPEGALQAPKRYIYDGTGKVLAEKIGDAEKKIENLLGLNYDRFLRSALLAQGEFSRFLKAKADERAELLESLTGTEIYSLLGQLAHTETGTREAELQKKEERLQQIPILPNDERVALEQSVKSGKEQLEKLEKEMEDSSRLLEKINQLQTARDNEKKAVVNLQRIDAERDKAGSDLDRLKLHKLTIPFAEDLGKLESAERTFETASKNQSEATQVLKDAQQAMEKANQALRAAVEKALEASEAKATLARESIKQEKAKADTIKEWLEENKKDANLADLVGELAAGIGNLKSAREAFLRAQTDWKGTATDLLPEAAAKYLDGTEIGAESQLVKQLDGFLAEAKKKQDAMEKDCDEALKQFDLRKDHLEKAKLIAQLTDHRHSLKSGEACPLCGALQHPYAEGAAPNPEIAKLENELKAAEKKLSNARQDFQNINKTLGKLTADRDKPIKALSALDAATSDLTGRLQPLSAAVPAPGKEDELRINLQNRGKDYREHLDKLKDTEPAIKDQEGKATAAEKETTDLKTKLGKLPPLPTESSRAVFSGKPPSVGNAEQSYADAVNEENAARKQAESREKDMANAALDLSGIRKRLEKAAADSEFKTLEKLKVARLPAKEAERLEVLEKNLKDRSTAEKALLDQALKVIEKLLEEMVPEGELAKNAQEAQSARKENRDQLLKDQTTRSNQLQTDAKNRRLREETDRELDVERKSLVVWQKLRELIGSHDGAKFRKYAQSISLDILTRHANRHLTRLSDRYRIRRDTSETLNLQVEDLDQAGVRRPMASLSGGESFLVSLALALGLSDLAGRTVRIDSLFVDEGFGTLDPETLEIAIAALETLRQDHKTVGVISHVGLLKERISTQIVVEKHAGGVSAIRIVS